LLARSIRPGRGKAVTARAGGSTGLTRGRRRVVPAVALAALMALTACSDSGSSPREAAPRAGAGGVVTGEPAGVSQARIDVTPAAGTRGVAPRAEVKVTVEAGTLTDVRLADGKGREVEGKLTDDGSSWSSTEPLAHSRRYTVRAEAADDNGVSTTTTSKFRTVKPKDTLGTSISPLSGSVVGVGMPIVVKLSAPVSNRADVEKALTVTSSKAVQGSWHWFSDEELHYRPKDYWPAHTDVKLDVDLDGVDAGGGVWGDESRTVEFSTDAAMVSVVDVKKLTMTVKRDGKVLRTFPVTTGKDGFLTRGGIKVISEKYERKVMDARTIGISPGDPEYYNLDVPYALRVTWSGEFVHAAEWSTGQQGRANVSHGCVGMSMANGKWFFNESRVGDVIQVVGSNRELEKNNGWTDWNVPWDEWKAGSALV
jgi:lipoprotein-anchoring transpeptidase ErfK/SrfK